MVAAVRLLVVEDNPGDARLVELALADEKSPTFEIERVDRVSTALKRLQRPGIDLVLLDRWLPDSEGWGGLGQIQSRAAQLPVIVLTGSVEPRLAREALERGAQDYLMKGLFPKGVLGERVRSALARHRVGLELAEGKEPSAPRKKDLDELEDGVACSAGEQILYANPAMARLGGGRSSRPPSLPKGWPQGLLRSAIGTAPPSGADSPPRFYVGDMILEGPGGATVDVEYRIKTWWPPEGAHSLVWARQVESERASPSRLPSRLPGSGKLPGPPSSP